MESNPQQSLGSQADVLVEADRGKKKIGRITEQTKGLFDDFTGWVEVRLKLFQLEMQEKIQSKVSEAAIKVAPFIAGALTGLFFLVTAALFIGWWLGHPAWGYLVVTGFLGLITVLLGVRAARVKRRQESQKKTSTNGSPGRSAARALPRPSGLNRLEP